MTKAVGWIHPKFQALREAIPIFLKFLKIIYSKILLKV